MLKSVRLTSLNLNGGSFHAQLPNSAGVESNQISGGTLQVDEMVFSPQGGILTALQDPPKFTSILNDFDQNSARSIVL